MLRGGLNTKMSTFNCPSLKHTFISPFRTKHLYSNKGNILNSKLLGINLLKVLPSNTLKSITEKKIPILNNIYIGLTN